MKRPICSGDNLSQSVGIPMLLFLMVLLCPPSQGHPAPSPPIPLPADSTAALYTPAIYLDGRFLGRRLDALNPDSIRLMKVERSGAVDTIRVTSLNTPADGQRWLSPAQARELPAKKVKFTVVNVTRSEKDMKPLEELSDENIKSIEYSLKDKTLKILTRDREFFPIELHIGDSVVRNSFWIHAAFKKMYPNWTTAERAVYCAAKIDTILNMQQPRFMGFSLEIFRTWVSKQLQYPQGMVQSKVPGRVVVSFRIDTTGQLCDIRILSSTNRFFSEEVIRVLKLSPPWEPANLRGDPMNFSYNLPFNFNISTSRTVPGPRLSPLHHK